MDATRGGGRKAPPRARRWRRATQRDSLQWPTTPPPSRGAGPRHPGAVPAARRPRARTSRRRLRSRRGRTPRRASRTSERSSIVRMSRRRSSRFSTTWRSAATVCRRSRTASCPRSRSRSARRVDPRLRADARVGVVAELCGAGRRRSASAPAREAGRPTGTGPAHGPRSLSGPDLHASERVDQHQVAGVVEGGGASRATE